MTAFKKQNLTELLNNKYHPYHIVDPSPWPFLIALNAFSFIFLVTGYLHKFFKYETMTLLLIFGLIGLIYTMFCWFNDVVIEGTYLGNHTRKVQFGLRFGFILFIISEIMFFISFFWAFFHSSLSPVVFIGNIWPPLGVDVFSPWGVPLFNTVILLLSGATVTWSHFSILNSDYENAFFSLFLTVFLGFFFTACQGFEYLTAPFSISDSIYGSLFYMLTGFHGLHVLIGTLFLFYCLLRLQKGHFSNQHHLGFEFASWYWHFVDVVWLFLYSFVYVWSSL